MDIVDSRKHNPVREGLEETGLYHTIELPDGTILRGAMPMEWQRERLASFGLPANLASKRVLDIGPWDGFYTFEIERLGASVTAIDYVDLDTFRALHRIFRSKADYRKMEVYEIDKAVLGDFDYVLCLGVLYHLKYPIEGLERICAVTRETCIVDTFVCDGEQHLAGEAAPLTVAEFYERAELAGQLDNWWGPSVQTVAAWLRTAGFVDVEIRRVTPASATFAAHRHWRNLPPDSEAPVALVAMKHHANTGRTFRTGREEYLEFWAEWTDSKCPAEECVYTDVDGFAVPLLGAAVTNNLLQVTVRVPYGMAPGRHAARLKVGNRAWSQPQYFYLDLPPASESVDLLAVTDGVSWEPGTIDWHSGGCGTAWTRGLSAEADPGNVEIIVSGIPHTPVAVYPATGQINFRLRPVVTGSSAEVHLTHRGSQTAPLPVKIVGTPPPIKGLQGKEI